METHDFFDPVFWENSDSFFQKYNNQKKLIIKLLEEISNEFPVKKQRESIPGSKGNKIFQGYNLKGRPYQVLDMVRLFDRGDGINIRVLHWVGKGLYIFLYLGKNPASTKFWDEHEYFPLKMIFNGKTSFDYPFILKNSQSIKGNILELKDREYVVLWEKIPIRTNFKHNLDNINSMIQTILDYTH
ncbi:hypothetical protein A33Q_3125 [Indibacter alkaliphilus LW1]|uniref:Uncharacterized protein n=1 Tax=Indibacter alkaliphilus (strain CCUG 57479 / KCTC 22604 / LW1) TaxID=1189612 RepID=S2E0Z7_INDAL|nr:hypothetical protein [Indibacter alkaliphilus]EOZ95763.1 hypothetical protein A33Q_3125 [Indibacter alkaliphilus LW1]